jgi:hypothetical protein
MNALLCYVYACLQIEASLIIGMSSTTPHLPDTHTGLHSISFHRVISVRQIFTSRNSGAVCSKIWPKYRF